MTDLPRLVRISRGVVAERHLCCPRCGSTTVELVDYLLVCPCGASFSKLAELKAVSR